MVFNWQHSKSYTIPQPTDLFCHVILLAKFNMFTSFSLHFLVNIEGAYYPHIVFQWSKGHSVSLQKTWRNLFINTFHDRNCIKSWNFWQSGTDIHLKISRWPVCRIMEVFILKACVRYFFSNFYFTTKW